MNQPLPHQQRVIDEKADLDAKLIALHRFIGGDIFQDLGEFERYDLMEQSETMKTYSRVLARRIRRFGLD